MNPDDPPEGIDIERHNAKDVVKPRIDKAGVRIQKEDPTVGGCHTGQHKGYPEEELKASSEGNFGAGQDPGYKNTDDKDDGLTDNGHLNGIPQGLLDPILTEGLSPSAKTILWRIGYGCDIKTVDQD